MSLTDAVHLLVRPHLTHRPDGVPITRDAWLDQLAGAVHTISSGGGRDSNEPPIPINTAALNLWRRLDREVRRDELDRAGHARGHLGGILTRWADETRPDWTLYLERACYDMVDEIRDLLDPPPKRRPLNQPCPACGITYATNADDERVPALTAGTHERDGTMRQPRDYDVTCADCGADWVGGQLSDLLAELHDETVTAGAG